MARFRPRQNCLSEAAKERPFFTESNKGLGIAAPRPPPTRAKPASFRERETNPLDRLRQIRYKDEASFNGQSAEVCKRHRQRGLCPPRPANAGQCPQKGETPAEGGKPSATVFRQARLSRETAALGFGVARRRVSPVPLDSPQIMRDWSEAEIARSEAGPTARARTNQRRARGVEGPSLSLDRAKRNPPRPPPRWKVRKLCVARNADEPARPAPPRQR